MEKFFQYLNMFPMPMWLAMMFAPRHPITEKAARSSTVFGIAAINYLISLGLAMRSGAKDSARDGEIVPSGGNVMTLEGVNTLISSKEGTLAAWAHMLALDLFTGAWIYRQCRELDAPAWVRIPSLFGTLMAGPAGLLYFLLWKANRKV